MEIRQCQHVRATGNVCGSPALKEDDFCYFHAAQRDRRLRLLRNERLTAPYQLPLLEDASAVQLAIMDIANAYLADRIEHKKAALILYALQTAAANSRNVRFPNVEDGTFPEYEAIQFYDHDNLSAPEAIEARSAESEEDELGAEFHSTPDRRGKGP